jgi:hypothetical protein
MVRFYIGGGLMAGHIISQEEWLKLLHAGKPVNAVQCCVECGKAHAGWDGYCFDCREEYIQRGVSIPVREPIYMIPVSETPLPEPLQVYLEEERANRLAALRKELAEIEAAEKKRQEAFSAEITALRTEHNLSEEALNYLREIGVEIPVRRNNASE